ncbi:MAG: tetratricopeptide repeat protein, partial [Muribaculaceae bacterium]|nr:tetratricopeptide repeat protein [Muribaculaceae bacterium]
YEKKHQDRGFYPEALYYAGRVYADLGDAPTALTYFQLAKDRNEAGSKDPILQGCIMSQTGRIYHNLELYSEASIYLREVIKINEARKDTVNLSFDNQLLGAGMMHAGKMDSARIHIDRAYQLAKSLPPEYLEFMSLYKAMLNKKMGQPDSARFYIKGIPSKIWEDVLPMALATVSEIYLNANQPDSAFKYASMIIKANDSSYIMYKRSAYNVVLSSKVRHLLPPDSIYPYTIRFLDAANVELTRRDEKSVSHQRDTYNYALHLKKSQAAENKSSFLTLLLYVLALIILVLLIVLLLIKNRKNKRIIRLLEANEMLSKKIEYYKNISVSDKPDKRETIESKDSERCKENELQNELETNIMELCNLPGEDKIDEIILISPVFNSLQEYISKGKVIGDEDRLWDEIEKIVLTASPSFIRNLRLITGGVTQTEKRLALLIKCGIKPSQAAILFSLSKQAISGRRVRLKKKFETKDIDVESLDRIIRRL